MKKLSKKEQIFADVDDEIYLLTKRIQLKHSLSWNEARDMTNYSLRNLMLSYPEYWLKK